METKKYIIEIPDNTAWIQWVKVSDKDGHVCFDFKDPEDLIPYTEPDLERVRQEAYQNGLKAAWDAARKIVLSREDGGLFSYEERKAVFGCGNYMALKKYSSSEAIEKIRQYEQRQEEPKKEQSVTAEDVMRQYLDTFCSKNRCTGCPLHTPDYTCGRGYHFLTRSRISNEEVRRAYSAVLAKMKVES